MKKTTTAPVAKKAVVVKKPRKVTPLINLPSILGGWSINRQSDGVIYFGCGEIRTNKEQLKGLLAALPLLKEIRKGWRTSPNTVVDNLTVSALKRIIGE